MSIHRFQGALQGYIMQIKKRLQKEKTLILYDLKTKQQMKLFK